MLTAYYFRQHMYTLVPKYVREDMAWMADVGTDAIAVGLLEQDLYAAVENVRIVAEEADRAGMKLLIVPSRWGGLVAGSPKVPSYFTATHPETWIHRPDGSPHYNGVCGPISSVFHPTTYEFLCDALTQALAKFPIAGVIWDELKCLDFIDASPAARDALGPEPAWEDYVAAVAAFFGRVNRFAKGLQEDLSTHLFLYATMPDCTMRPFASVDALDYFGCDGRPWAKDDTFVRGQGGKALLGGDGQRFIDAARAAGAGTLALIENHDIAAGDLPLIDRRLPEVLALDIDHWLYYYYGRSCEDPDGTMEVMARHLRTLR